FFAKGGRGVLAPVQRPDRALFVLNPLVETHERCGRYCPSKEKCARRVGFCCYSYRLFEVLRRRFKAHLRRSLMFLKMSANENCLVLFLMFFQNSRQFSFLYM